MRSLLVPVALLMLLACAAVQAEESTPEEQRNFDLVLRRKVEVALAGEVSIAEHRSLIEALLELLKELLDYAVRNCAVEIVKTCKKAPRFLKCARDYIKNNRGRCAIP